MAIGRERRLEDLADPPWGDGRGAWPHTPRREATWRRRGRWGRRRWDEAHVGSAAQVALQVRGMLAHQEARARGPLRECDYAPRSVKAGVLASRNTSLVAG